jgi:hypothetical protein
MNVFGRVEPAPSERNVTLVPGLIENAVVRALGLLPLRVDSWRIAGIQAEKNKRYPTLFR